MKPVPEQTIGAAAADVDEVEAVEGINTYISWT
jgi:hypothetical protein